MQIEETTLPGVIVLVPRRFEDPRGWFCETWNLTRLRELGLELDFVQDNHSFSVQKGTLRGLHYQRPPYAQDKLVRCTRGSILDVAVDVRLGSPSYGRWVSKELSAQNGHQLLVPKGFLHGFLTLTPDCEVQYKCTNTYSAECDGAVRFDDPDLAIDWGLSQPPVLSDKDAAAPAFADWTSPFTYEAAA